MYIYQNTLKDFFEFSGVGLHSGENMNVKVYPAPPDTGILFRRVDIKNCDYVKVTPYSVVATQLATTISCGPFPISTVEHLLSALFGLGVDNAKIDVHGAEIPILDGSSLIISQLIDNVGVIKQNKYRKFLKVLSEVKLEYDDKIVKIEPHDKMKITFEIQYPHIAIGHQIKEVDINPETYRKTIANARTFGFKKDVDMLHKMGLAKGGSVNNAIIIDNESNDILNPEGLRKASEFIDHKILDIIGDLSLLGYQIIGSIYAKKSGHKMNNMFARKLFESLNAYDIICVNSTKQREN